MRRRSMVLGQGRDHRGHARSKLRVEFVKDRSCCLDHVVQQCGGGHVCVIALKERQDRERHAHWMSEVGVERSGRC